MKNKVIYIVMIIIMIMVIFIPNNIYASGLFDIVRDRLYVEPGTTDNTTTNSLDDTIQDADEFVNQEGGDFLGATYEFNQSGVQDTSSILFNTFFIIGVAVSVIMGVFIGIKYVTASVEGKAEAKKLLVPFVVGCVVVYGALGIWKLVLMILDSV